MQRNLLGVLAVVVVPLVGVEAAEAGFIFDAEGDALPVLGEPGPLLDIDTVALTYDADWLYFEVTFFTPIQPASSGAANGLYGVIDLDVDQSSLTGVPPMQNSWSPPFENLTLGVDFLIVLFDVPIPGQVEVYDTTDYSVVATVPVHFDLFSISGAVPLSVIGLPALRGQDDGVVDYAAVVGTFAQPTDAGDYAGTSVIIPSPAVMALLGIAGIAGPRRRRRRE